MEQSAFAWSLQLSWAGLNWRLQEPPTSLARTLHFDQPQASAYGIEPAQSESWRTPQGDFVGAVAQGAPCNVERVTLTPHGNGTHTEDLRHILTQPQAWPQPLPHYTGPALLLDVPTRSWGEALAQDPAASYTPTPAEHEGVVHRTDLQPQLEAWRHLLPNCPALILRTHNLPNTTGARNYAQAPAPFFTDQAMALLAQLPAQHLLTDLPSLDRADDAGRLANHRQWWGRPLGDASAPPQGLPERTITELLRIPDTLPAGPCWLNLAPAPWVADAAPVRPLVWRLQPC